MATKPTKPAHIHEGVYVPDAHTSECHCGHPICDKKLSTYVSKLDRRISSHGDSQPS